MISQLFGAAVLLVAVLGLGLCWTGLVRRRLALDPYTTSGLIPLLGVVAVGGTTFVAGQLNLLHTALPMALGIAGALCPALLRVDVRRVGGDLALAARTAWRLYPWLVGALTVAVILLLAAGLAAPSRTDEIEYHWPAPVAWAENGQWNESPYRHVNAFPFMEIVYTSAALVDSYVAAHWIHALTMIGMGLCAAGIAATLGSTLTVPILAAAVVSPVVWLQSFAAYNDVAAAAFSVAAVAVMLSGGYARSAVITCCLLLVTAISIKPTSVVAVGVVGLIALLSAWWKVRPHPTSIRSSVRLWIPLAAAAGLTIAFWTVRQRIYTGHWLDPAMTAQPDAYAQTMLPDGGDRLLWPVVPFISGLLGAAEPWGGRTSLVVQALLIPALVYALWRRGSVLRRFAVLAVPAYVHWILLGVAIVRTRFHIMSWVLLAIAIGLVAEDFVQERPRWRWVLRITWLALVLVGLLDVLRQTLTTISMID